MKGFIERNNNLRVLDSCIIFSSLLVILFSCSKIYESEDFDELPNPYKNKTSSEFIAVFGDIQYYTFEEYIQLYKNSLNWLEENQDEINILCVLCTGDIIHSTSQQWKFFDEAMEGFTLPFISNIGNHDYNWKNGLIYDRYDTFFNEHNQFPLLTSRIENYFEDGRIENIVVRNEIQGQRYDLLLLEFGPRKEVVAWAKEWVAEHPDIKYILMTHEYLEQGGGRRTSGLKSELQLRNTTMTSPNELWEQLITCNDNIVCVLCGHVGGLYAVTFEKNDFGREVCQIQHNIQSQKYRYDNWLMMWEFPNDSDDAVVSIVNTKTGRLYDSKEALFKFKYRY